MILFQWLGLWFYYFFFLQIDWLKTKLLLLGNFGDCSAMFFQWVSSVLVVVSVFFCIFWLPILWHLGNMFVVLLISRIL